MQNHKIFTIEFVIDDLKTFSKTEESVADVTHKCEKCVKFKFMNLVRFEICEKDFGSKLDVACANTGKNCLFTMDTEILNDEMFFEIYAYKRHENNSRIFIGNWCQPARKMFEDLCKRFDSQITRADNGSIEMISSLIDQSSNISMKSIDSKRSKQTGGSRQSKKYTSGKFLLNSFNTTVRFYLNI